MEVKIKKLTETAREPTYATPGSAAFDLYADKVTELPAGSEEELARLMGDESYVFHTGLAVEIPEGHALLIFSRSGDGFKRDLRLANCVGLIDSDYRGEVLVKLRRDGDRKPHGPWEVCISSGDRIAQGLIVEVERATFSVVDELSSTERGAGGFGSTGA